MSARDSYPAEQCRDADFEEVVRKVCARPASYVGPATVGKVCAYLDGFNAARGGGPLLGFQQWLVVRSNGGNNLHWSDLAFRLLPPQSDARVGGDEEQCRIRALGRVIEGYLRYRDANGVTKVFYDYGRWLLRKHWYGGPLRTSRQDPP